MIKIIIEGLATDSISLTKALTMSKIVASNIRNDYFKQWIKSELEGYSSEKSELPNYRVLPCQLIAKEFYFNQFHERPVDAHELDKNFQEKSGCSLYKMYVSQSVSTIEEMLNGKTKGAIHMSLPPFLLTNLKSSSYDCHDIYDIQQTADISLAKNILVQVKQKLLDTLLELSEQFPDLKSENFLDSKNKDKANNIVTLNIYGGTPNITSIIGDGNTQIQSPTEVAEKFCKKLKDMGVSENDAEEAKRIIIDKEKPEFKERILSWVGNMTNTAIKEGIKIEVGKLLTMVGSLL